MDLPDLLQPLQVSVPTSLKPPVRLASILPLSVGQTRAITVSYPGIDKVVEAPALAELSSVWPHTSI